MVSSELTFSPAAKKRVRFHQDNNHANKAVMGVMQTEQIEQMGSNSKSLSISIHEDSEEYLSRAIEIPVTSSIFNNTTSNNTTNSSQPSSNSSSATLHTGNVVVLLDSKDISAETDNNSHININKFIVSGDSCNSNNQDDVVDTSTDVSLIDYSMTYNDKIVYDDDTIDEFIKANTDSSVRDDEVVLKEEEIVIEYKDKEKDFQDKCMEDFESRVIVHNDDNVLCGTVISDVQNTILHDDAIIEEPCIHTVVDQVILNKLGTRRKHGVLTVCPSTPIESNSVTSIPLIHSVVIYPRNNN